MIANVQLFLLWLLVTFVLYAAIPCSFPRSRQVLLAALSFVLIFAIAPWAALICIVTSLAVVAWSHVLCRKRNGWVLALGAITVAAPLATIRIVDDPSFLVTLGVTFLTLKSLSALLDGYTAARPLRLRDVLLLNLFFPIYGAGPIEHVGTFVEDKLRAPVTLDNVALGLGRIVIGIFKASFICEQVLEPFIATRWPEINSAPGEVSVGGVYLYVIVKFLYAYINFSGYTDIAIGSGRLFSIVIVENFNLPVIARNLQDFWRRWHISLGNWVMQYLFFPIFATIKKPWGMQLSIIVSFFFIGLWHEASWTYMAWGLFHGCGLAVVQTVRQWGKNRPVYHRLQQNPAYILFCIILTVFYVSWVQTFANAPSLGAAIGWSLRLVGV